MVKTYPEPQPGRPKSPDCCHMGTPENKLPDQTQRGTDTVSLRHSTTSFPSGSAPQHQRTCSSVKDSHVERRPFLLARSHHLHSRLIACCFHHMSGGHKMLPVLIIQKECRTQQAAEAQLVDAHENVSRGLGIGALANQGDSSDQQNPLHYVLIIFASGRPVIRSSSWRTGRNWRSQRSPVPVPFRERAYLNSSLSSIGTSVLQRQPVHM